MPVGTSTQLSDMIAQDPACTIAAETYDFYDTTDLATWEQKSSLVGTGQCVPLVQQATGAPQTGLWRKGPKVKGNTKIPLGTAIATFDAKGLYADHSTGNHAAIFVSISDKGIVVVDQWKSKIPAKPSRRTIRFRNGTGSPSNDGDQFSVIVTLKIQNHPAKTGT